MGVNTSAAFRAAFLSAAIVVVPALGANAQTIANASASDEGDIFQRLKAASAGKEDDKTADVAADDGANGASDPADADAKKAVTLADILNQNRKRQEEGKEGAQEAATADEAEGGKVAKVEKPLEEQSRASGYAANPFGSIISSYASAYGVPEALAHAVVRVESNFRPTATGAAGEIGLMQLKLGTARMMGYSGSASALYDPETNIKYGMKYLAKARQLSDGSTCGTILKYNAGHGAKRMNPVSANYCQKVASIMN